jgi:hypothetical protein
MEYHLDSQIFHPFAFRDPLESHFLAPLPFFVFFVGPDRCCFVPVYFFSQRLTENVQDFLRPFYIVASSLQVERNIIRKGLVCYFPSSREGQTFYFEAVVIEHSYDILGAGMLWKPKEARILMNFIDQPMNIGDALPSHGVKLT